MAQNSNIEWTDATFNPWRGCTRLSEGCRFCYAETLSKRNPATLGEWGPNGKRAIAAESYWKLPEQWDRAAEKAGVRRKVFCASLADVFEDRVELHLPRQRLLGIIARTPNLDWLLLTKRPENIMPAISFLADSVDLRIPSVGSWQGTALAKHWVNGNPPSNVWLGVSVENEDTAEERLPLLQQVLAAVRFVSYEPALGPVDWERWLQPYCPRCRDSYESADGQWAWLAGELWPIHHCDEQIPSPRWFECRPAIDWIIAGGESGPNARPMHIEWARSARDKCVEYGVPFFFKQFGEWAPGLWHSMDEERATRSIMLATNGARFDGDVCPDLIHFCRMHPDAIPFYRWGKKVNGRRLDGKEWSQFPTPPMDVCQ